MSSAAKLFDDFKDITFKAGPRFAWSPKNKTVFYEEDALETDIGKLSLLHEVSHALLNHYSYKSDLHLMKMEVEAWAKARQLAQEYFVKTDDDYIDDCLESYRDWLYRRSMCVTCGTNSLQDEDGVYNCHICSTTWTVPDSQLCKVQRTIKKNPAA